MNSEILISYIIPLYNCGKYIKRCIQSVESQHNRGGYEIIVVDDGSTDGGGDIVAEMQKSNPAIKLIRQANGGVSKARNVAIDNASGKYIYCVDADDVVIRNAMADRLRYMEENNVEIMYSGGYRPPRVEHPNLDEIFNKAEIFEQDKLNILSAKDFAVKLFQQKFEVFPSSYIIRRDLIERVGHRYKDGMAIGEDAYFIFELLANVKQVVVSLAPIFVYIYYPNSSFHRVRPFNELSEITIGRQLAFRDLFSKYNYFFETEDMKPIISSYQDCIIFTDAIWPMFRDIVSPKQCISAIRKMKSLDMYPIGKPSKRDGVSLNGAQLICRMVWHLSRYYYLWIAVLAVNKVLRTVIPIYANKARKTSR